MEVKKMGEDSGEFQRVPSFEEPSTDPKKTSFLVLQMQRYFDKNPHLVHMCLYCGKTDSIIFEFGKRYKVHGIERILKANFSPARYELSEDASEFYIKSRYNLVALRLSRELVLSFATGDKSISADKFIDDCNMAKADWFFLLNHFIKAYEKD
jgi:hypothetical protein